MDLLSKYHSRIFKHFNPIHGTPHTSKISSTKSTTLNIHHKPAFSKNNLTNQRLRRKLKLKIKAWRQ